MAGSAMWRHGRDDVVRCRPTLRWHVSADRACWRHQHRRGQPQARQAPLPIAWFRLALPSKCWSLLGQFAFVDGRRTHRFSEPHARAEQRAQGDWLSHPVLRAPHGQFPVPGRTSASFPVRWGCLKLSGACCRVPRTSPGCPVSRLELSRKDGGKRCIAGLHNYNCPGFKRASGLWGGRKVVQGFVSAGATRQGLPSSVAGEAHTECLTGSPPVSWCRGFWRPVAPAPPPNGPWNASAAGARAKTARPNCSEDTCLQRATHPRSPTARASSTPYLLVPVGPSRSPWRRPPSSSC